MRALLKRTGAALAWLASRSPLLSTAYLGMLSTINRWTRCRYQSYLLNSIARVHWPASVLRWPRRVRLAGLSGDTIRLHPHQGEFDFDAVLQGELHYEPEVFAALVPLLGTHDYVIEIGANVGIFTVWLEQRLRQCPRLRGHYVFEPSVEAHARLVRNAAANECRRLSLLNLAVSDQSGTLTFYEPQGHLTNGSFSRAFAELFSETVRECRVPAATLDFLRDLIPDGAAILLKVDVEGHELGVLRGCESLFRRTRVDLVIELLEATEVALCLQQLQRLCEVGAPTRLGERDWLLCCRPRLTPV